MRLCRGGKLEGLGETQSFDPKEIGRMLKQNVPEYLKMCYYQGKKQVKTISLIL